MGLLDTLAGSVGSGGGGQPDLMKIVMSLVQQAGGIEALMAKLQQGGLAEAAASWVSTGPNLAVSPVQLEGALGGDLLSTLAQQFGVGQGDLAGQLSKLLPQAVDKLSPGGQLPPPGSGGQDFGALLGSLLR
ncbi:MAG: DUF937 domain-containing protein [Rubrivivax sp.]|nr:DUF937 domain-containing protein [Rubrivivax sp.]